MSSEKRHLRERWKTLSVRERVGWWGVALCLVGAVAVNPLLRWAIPQVATEAAYEHDLWVEQWLGIEDRVFLDPWGTPWAVFVSTASPGAEEEWRVGSTANVQSLTAGARSWSQRTCSAGPNRQLEVSEPDWRLTFKPHSGFPFDDLLVNGASAWNRNLGGYYWWARPLAWVQEFLILFSLLLAWTLRGPGVHSPRSPQLWRELAVRVPLAASLPTAAVLAILMWGSTQPWEVEGTLRTATGTQTIGRIAPVYKQLPATEALETSLLVSRSVAVVGSVLLICVLLTLWWRSSRPLEEEVANQ